MSQSISNYTLSAEFNEFSGRLNELGLAPCYFDDGTAGELQVTSLEHPEYRFTRQPFFFNDGSKVSCYYQSWAKLMKDYKKFLKDKSPYSGQVFDLPEYEEVPG